MCGIVGVFGCSSDVEGADIVERMNACIVHRGPDDQGIWADTTAAVGMRRLSILDPDGGHQPMRTPDGVVIVFNGEIYNHAALRAGLERAGYRFRTRSDTEVVLHLYHQGGLQALEQLEGMFGIAVVDLRNRQAHLVRDRIGIKPLYYGRFGGRLYFGSEIKSILAALATRPAVDTQAVHDFLYLRYVPAPATIWQGIAKLMPGHRLSFDLDRGDAQVERWWRPVFEAAPPDPGRDYVREFRERFLHAVESHLVNSDVPVGTLLSGGIDSSAVSAAVAELGVRGLHSFTVAFEDGAEFSELTFARQVAEHVGARHHEVTIGKRQFLEFLPRFVWHTDEPLADLASIPLHWVSEEARRHVKVVLSGEGADELLAGYAFDTSMRWLDARRAALAGLPAWALRAGAAVTRGARSSLLAAAASGRWSEWGANGRMSATDLWTGPRLAALWRGPNALPPERVIEHWYERGVAKEPLDALQQAWCQDWLVEDLLMKADRMTMASSIELRVPFLTHSFVDWARTLPIQWRVGDATSGYSSKRLLRAYCEGRLPREIIDRPKRGFPVPAYRWLADDDVGGWARSRVDALAEPLKEWLSTSVVQEELSRARAGDTDAAQRVWSVLVLDEWARCWLH